MANLNFLKKKQPEWNDQKFYYEGAKAAGIKGLRFGVTLDQSHFFGEGDENYGVQRGNREPKGSFKMSKNDVDTMNMVAIAAGGRDLTDLVGNIVITYEKAGARKFQKITLVAVHIGAFEYGWDQGAKEMMIELPFLYEQLIIEEI